MHVEKEDQATVELGCAANIKPEPIIWLWKDWLALGKLHILAGQPGVGKSTIALKRGNVIIWSGEDDAGDTIVPRLEASGADLSRVHIVRCAKDGKGKRPFDPSRDIQALCEAIKAIGGAVMIIIDPIVMAIAKDSHKNAETRRDLRRLRRSAATIGPKWFTQRQTVS